MKSLAIASLVGLAGLAIGCGGSDAGPIKTSDLSKTEWIAKADQICTDGNAQIGAGANDLFGTDGEKPSEDDQARFVSDVVVPETSEQVDEIRGLGAPKGDEETVQKILDTTDDGLKKLEDDPKLLLGDDNPLDDGTKLAAAYGLQVCGAG